MKIGIDVGGTHTDAVLFKDGLILKKVKILNNDTKDSIISSILSLIGKTDKQIDVSISTTLVTNAISKNQMESSGMFLIPGFAPLSFLYDFIPYLYVSQGYIDHRGEVIRKISEKDLADALDYFRKNNVKNIGIVSKFSTRNPTLEKEAAIFFKKEGFNVIEGSSLSGKLDFPRRVMTTFLSCGIYSIYQNVIKDIESGIKEILPNCKITILKADGGSIPLDEAIKRPIDTLLSGPAASMMGALWYLRDLNEDFMVLDVGGTTSDLGFFINGSPVVQKDGISLGKIKTLIRGLKVYSLPIGGDSFFINEGGSIRITNKRVGVPYIFGGPKPTLTDLSVYLSSRDKKAEDAFIKEGFSVNDIDDLENIVIDFLGSKIKNAIDLVNERHIYTIKEFFEKRFFNPKKIMVVGGGAPYFKRFLSKLEYEVILPENFDVCNAIGAALARPSYELNLFANTLDGRVTIPEISYYNSIDYSFDEKKARSLILEKIRSLTVFEPDIVEEEVFNMVRGFSRIGKNIRIVAQIKPGLIV